MSRKMYGYARVSTREQNTDRQMAALREFGIPEKNIFEDYVSGKNFERPSYRLLISKLREGDLLAIKSIDRLGRNYEEIKEQWRHITRDCRADIVVLDMPLLDTRRDRDLIGTLISDIVLELLSYVAQTEREFIRQRQAEGIAQAKARGVRFGRKCLPVPENYPEVYEAWSRGDISSREAGRRLNVTHKTFLKWTKATEAKTGEGDKKSTHFSPKY